jgi:hypothetical protein
MVLLLALLAVGNELDAPRHEVAFRLPMPSEWVLERLETEGKRSDSPKIVLRLERKGGKLEVNTGLGPLISEIQYETATAGPKGWIGVIILPETLRGFARTTHVKAAISFKGGRLFLCCRTEDRSPTFATQPDDGLELFVFKPKQ